MVQFSNVLFGPAGIPIQCKESSTLEGIKCCKELGLGAMEMEFVRGVKMSEKTASEVKKSSEEAGIMLSSHAPYYINLCSLEEQKIKNTLRHLFQSARATAWTGGRITVFHPGYYQKLGKDEAYGIAKKHLQVLEDELKQYNIRITLGAETVGKKSQFGGLAEVVRLSQELDMVEPTIDFCHLVARGDFKLGNESDYLKVFTYLEKELGRYVKRFHSHFSEVNYSDKGEINHIPLGTKHQPPFKPLMKVLAENGYCGVIICESPKIDFDAIKMKKEYDRLRERYGPAS